MEKTKTLALAVALMVLAITLIGVTYAQTVGAQTTAPQRLPSGTANNQPIAAL